MAELQLTEHLAMAFGTPVVAYRWPESDELNAQLVSTILKAEQASAGIVRSNVGGWHSTTDFLRWEAGCIKTLQKRAEQLAIELTRLVVGNTGAPRTFQFRSDGWANVLRNGQYNSVHNHPNSMWSGVYYVASGNPEPHGEENGKLELLDPRSGINMLYIERNVLDGRYLIDPLPGLMVLFPSWLKHMVHPYFGGGERISVSFNVMVAERPGDAAGTTATA